MVILADIENPRDTVGANQSKNWAAAPLWEDAWQLRREGWRVIGHNCRKIRLRPATALQAQLTDMVVLADVKNPRDAFRADQSKHWAAAQQREGRRIIGDNRRELGLGPAAAFQAEFADMVVLADVEDPRNAVWADQRKYRAVSVKREGRWIVGHDRREIGLRPTAAFQ